MAHPFRIREIAQQSGLSEATVDRVLHGRGGVRASTIAEVNRAIRDLSRQQTQLRLGGRTFLIDLVIDSPAPFAAAVRQAMEGELPSLRPAVIRSRFHLSDGNPVADQVRMLDGIIRRGSHGVILKAPKVPEVNEAVQRLERAGIPVITLVTDLPASPRRAYVGLDNRAAGSTAAYLIEQWLGGVAGGVLVTRGDRAFQGEDERAIGFQAGMAALAPDRPIVEVPSRGGEQAQRGAVAAALAGHELIGVYSMYASTNRVTLEAFEAVEQRCRVFLAHDLDEENRGLLVDGRISAVLHHDLRQDIRHACRMIMQAHGALRGEPRSVFTAVQIVTPWNLPPGTG